MLRKYEEFYTLYPCIKDTQLYKMTSRFDIQMIVRLYITPPLWMQVRARFALEEADSVLNCIIETATKLVYARKFPHETIEDFISRLIFWEEYLVSWMIQPPQNPQTLKSKIQALAVRSFFNSLNELNIHKCDKASIPLT